MHASNRSRRRLSCNVLALLFLLSALVYAPFAQGQIGGQGAISGTVTDQSGAAIPGATVSATNIGTNSVTTRTTSSAGYYVLSPIAPGEYTITTSAQGFSPLTQEHLVVDALQTVGYSPKLTIGSVTEKITVDTAPPALETENATLGTTMEQKEYTNLPLIMNGSPRNPTSFVGLMPGVNGGVGRSGEFNGSGSAGYLDEVYVDGIPLTAPVQQGDNRSVAYTVSPEAVEQFQVQTSGSPVEFEGAGIQNYVIKSGTNQYHGNLFGYVRNTIFDTWGFSAAVTNINSITKLPVKPVEHQLEVGGSLGGPIIKDKLFAFGTYDNFKYTSTPNPTQLTVPTMLARNGDFTEYPYPVYDPTTTAACTAATGTPCRYQFMGLKNGVPTPNVIDPSRISPISKALAAALPTPTNSALVNNYFSAIKTGTTYWKSAERVDYDLSSKQRLSGILLVGNYATVGPDYTSKLPLPYGTAEYVSQFSITGDVEHSYTITPHLVNQLKYAFNRLAAPDVNATLGTPNTAQNAGLTGLPAGEATDTFPAVNFSGGVDNPTSWHAISGSVSNNEVVNTYILIDNMQYLHGKHSMTFGGQIQWLQDNYKYPNNSNSFPMTYGFNSTETANFYPAGNKSAGTLNTAATGVAYAGFLLGAVDSSSLQITSLPETGARYKTYAPYFQDDYKALKNLTINLGIRWDLWTPFKEVRNRSAYFDPTETNPLTGTAGALKYYGNGPNSCNCSSPIQMWWKNVAPRIGFAYAVTPKTVIRGAYGISYARDAAEGGHNSGARTGPSQQGFAGTTSLAGTSLGEAAFSWDSDTSRIGPTVFGAGAFPGSVPVLPDTDPTQLSGNSSAQLTSAGAVVQGSTIGYGDPYLGRRVPYFQNINFGVQRAVTNTTTLSVNYVGSLGHFVPGAPRGYWTDKLDPKYLLGGLGPLLNLPANPANVAAAQKILPGFHLPYSTFAGSAATIAQALVPFPQYSAISDVWADAANTAYHSLQLTLNQKTWNGVTFTLNYTYALATGDADDSRSGYDIPAGVVSGLTTTAKQNSLDNSWQSNANKQQLTLYGVWELPFGKDRRFRGGNFITRPLINDWQFSSTYQYSSGGPVSVTASKCVLVGQGTCYPDLNPNFTGPIRMNGSVGKGYVAGGVSPVYINAAAFQDPAPYMIGNAPNRAPHNLWSPGSYTLNASLRKSFPIVNRYKFTFQADCFDVPNNVAFGYASTNIDSANFGQSNNGSGNRDWQFAGRFEF
ncbi:carboxypeptidase-like regulatory domain-containing protein [Granulicella mallensis]|uniref:TonB-dependent transporter Oar-like beta-barrel domain-containing protein n=1 Tax=Granulicella mallensis TaxID=940614 RepID=A0A7W7ZLT9_9BACT|nr:carboxypeptidase-like regulatory domain-containing protein [Granulicella mallensis]MBB5062301.1 hypothetical protein [Granulicella mallensis]